MANEERDRLIREALEPLTTGEVLSVDQLADRAAYSRFHFHRVVKRLLGETPGELRRRLLLERAAWQIAKEGHRMTHVAFHCGFDSLEGFGRAFKRAFGCAPSSFARSGKPLWLPSPAAIHFMPLSLIPSGGNAMDLIDRMMDTELATVRQLLALTDEQLSTPLPFPVQAMCYETPQRTVRDLLDWLLFTQEVWLAAVEKQTPGESRDTSREGLARRAEIVLPMFAGLVRRVRDTGEWNTEFVDELCDEPSRFTFGGMIAHVMVHGTFRRQMALAALRAAGVPEVGWGDPLYLEQGVTPV